ncbi:hypothetical protein DICSQDRAFT_128796 [Dichomitus squalens LYAD-421 SS1]|uniref:Uncharacterized protein n=1 Tax=Dichomitus squalens (strain LYAD-421) TaxID=732165 RepID=R7SRS6_DICSQ|nr:uncharacterized protein DICSQDRAFT_128796 [Dichomitus squalens LYAD-421 SS1]EJF58653.1 hypothetical protein DICSQDRAFT_128796 [Dichomitus squalens LYAD-421 SS1]
MVATPPQTPRPLVQTTTQTTCQSRYANAEPLLNPPHRCLIFHIDTLPLFEHALVEHSGIGLVVLPTLEVGDGVKHMRVTRVPVDLGTTALRGMLSRSERQRCGGQCMRTCQGMQREVLREGLYADVHEEVNENLRSIDDERGERQERGKPLNEPGPQNCTTESPSTAESRVSTVQTAQRVRSPVSHRHTTDGWNANRTSVGFWACVRVSNSSTISGLSRPRDLPIALLHNNGRTHIRAQVRLEFLRNGRGELNNSDSLFAND